MKFVHSFAYTLEVKEIATFLSSDFFILRMAAVKHIALSFAHQITV